SLKGAVHLDDLRCDGNSHGGCNAHCLIFWKEEWLEPAASVVENDHPDELDLAFLADLDRAQHSGDTRYSCQATELPRFTQALPWWSPRQYVDDVRGGNQSVRSILELGFLKFVQNRLEGGFAFRIWLSVYNALQGRLGGVPRTIEQGGVPAGVRTPS